MARLIESFEGKWQLAEHRTIDVTGEILTLLWLWEKDESGFWLPMMPFEPDSLIKIQQLLREWIEKQGHEACWYYPEIFERLCLVVGIADVPKRSISRSEFREGCQRFEGNLYDIHGG